MSGSFGRSLARSRRLNRPLAGTVRINGCVFLLPPQALMFLRPLYVSSLTEDLSLRSAVAPDAQ